MSDRLLKESDVLKMKYRLSVILGSEFTKEVKALPSADRPRGEWVTEYNGNGWNDYWDYTCTNCKMKFPRADNVLYKSNYCPNCGAKMKGADNE